MPRIGDAQMSAPAQHPQPPAPGAAGCERAVTKPQRAMPASSISARARALEQNDHSGATPTTGATYHQRVHLGAPIAYDAATRTVVLFSGAGRSGFALNGTWAWNSATWTKQAPRPARPPGSGHQWPTTRLLATVLFGGAGGNHVPNDTWVWGPG
jgi:hypothetical protein